MIKKFLLQINFAFVIIMATFFATSAFAASSYSFYWGLQKRTNEGNSPVYRINIYPTDVSSGDYVLEDVIKSLTLVGPSGPVTVPTLTFSVTKSLPLSFDAANGVWSYGADFDVFSSNIGYFDGPYEFGSYTITITDKNDDIITETKTFSSQPDLPQISSDSFQGEISSSGDLVWRWSSFLDADFWASGLHSTLRVWVYAENGGKYVAETFGVVPLNAGMLYVPKAVLDKLKLEGSTLGVGLHILNNDALSHHRYISKQIPLNELPKPGSTKSNSKGFFVIPVKVK